MAPTFALAHGTTGPTLKNLLSTATPSSPVCGSYAQIEKVLTAPPRTGGGIGLVGAFELQQAQPVITPRTAARAMSFISPPRKRFSLPYNLRARPCQGRGR